MAGFVAMQFKVSGYVTETWRAKHPEYERNVLNGYVFSLKCFSLEIFSIRNCALCLNSGFICLPMHHQ